MIHAQVDIEEIGYGDQAIKRTVSRMKEVIQNSLSNQRVRQKAEDIVSDVFDNDSEGEARAIFDYVQSKVRYTKDPKGLEYVQTPDHILKMIEYKGQAFGDCDDKTVLGLALLKTIGHDVAIKVVSYRPNQKYSHVYGLVRIGGKWVPFDTTRPDVDFGWEAKGATRTFETKVGYADSSVEGLDGVDWGQAFQIAVGSALGYVLIHGIIAQWVKKCQ